MRPFSFGMLAVAVLTASPAIAKDKKPVDPDKKVCRQSEVTGSIMMGKSVCHTVAEWAAIDRENELNTRDLRDHTHRGIGGTSSGG